MGNSIRKYATLCTNVPIAALSPASSRAIRMGSSLVAVLALVCFASTATASGISAPSVGTNRSNPVSLEPSAIFWNPGMLGFQQEHAQLQLGANLILGQIRYQRDYRGTYQREDSFDFAEPIDPQDIDPDKSGEQPNGNHFVIGPQVHGYLSVPISDSGVVAGLGVSLPFTAVVGYPEDGAQRFVIQDALIAAAYITPSIAYQITEAFSVGAGASFVLGVAELSRVQDFAEVQELGDGLSGPPVNQENDFGPNAPVGVRELDVLARPTQFEMMIATGFTFNVGFGVELDRVRFGASYQHKVDLDFRGDFVLDVDDDFFTQDLEAQGLDFPPIVEGDASLSITFPAMLHAGVAYDVSERLSLTAAFSYYFWSQTKAFDVVLESDELAQPDLGIGSTVGLSLERDWMDTIALSGIAAYKLNEKIEIWGLLGYQSNAVPDRTLDASSPDGDRLEIGAGGLFGISDRLDLNADLKLQHVFNRENRASEFDKGNGTYGLTLASLGLGLNIRLGKLNESGETGDASFDEEIETRAIPASDGTQEPSEATDEPEDDSGASEPAEPQGSSTE